MTEHPVDPGSCKVCIKSMEIQHLSSLLNGFFFFFFFSNQFQSHVGNKICCWQYRKMEDRYHELSKEKRYDDNLCTLPMMIWYLSYDVVGNVNVRVRVRVRVKVRARARLRIISYLDLSTIVIRHHRAFHGTLAWIGMAGMICNGFMAQPCKMMKLYMYLYNYISSVVTSCGCSCLEVSCGLHIYIYHRVEYSGFHTSNIDMIWYHSVRKIRYETCNDFHKSLVLVLVPRYHTESRYRYSYDIIQLSGNGKMREKGTKRPESYENESMLIKTLRHLSSFRTFMT